MNCVGLDWFRLRKLTMSGSERNKRGERGELRRDKLTRCGEGVLASESC